MAINLKTYSFLELFYPISKGNYRLTEHAIYDSLKYNSEMIPIWGGQRTHKFENQFISVNGKTLDNKSVKVFKGDCLIISLDGSAGCLTFKPTTKGNNEVKFALNHHAGIIRNKNKSIVNLEYFKFRYENFLKSLAVSEGSKTLTVGTI